ncbi:type III secretion system outer membrane ring subunit SctC [Paludibacterium paludis]|uniref:Type 3 secretion system secretin n=1 Tax=Paludibacterium paludis TaxID=1225769 RepID=A0A918UBC9_9NEIS|nr:type III secretion system outer membrane ring subunit SctC [Paludibacterium paludis]GGY24028.1 type III secretion system outer membrane pore InvG [Paludibacterium paludis]
MTHWKNRAICLLMILSITPSAVMAAPQGAAVAADAVAQAKPAAQGYVATNQGLRAFFDAISARLHKPVVISNRAERKSISGKFDLSDPQGLLERVSREMGLVWYYDGQSIYVYDAQEVKNAVVALHQLSLGAFTDFLKKSGLYDKRFPVKGDPMTGVFYISGPPMYVDLVSNLASFMDKDVQHDSSTREKVAVIHLHNTFVSDRTYPVRGQSVVLPGMATAIQSLLTSGKTRLDTSVRQSAPADTKPAPPTADAANQPTDLSDSISRLRAALAPSANAALPGAAGQNAQPEVDGMVPVSVVAYPSTNSLLVKGTPEAVRFVENLVAALDIPKRQVELSLWIIDIDKQDLDQLGVDWQGSVGIGGKLGVSFGDNVPTSTLDGATFLARVQALSQKGNAQIVSRPVVLTQENVPAVFDNNRTIYTKVTGERTANLDHYTFGTMIDVLPRFADNDKAIEMRLNIEDGNDDGTSGDTVDGLPAVNRTTINTVARVPKGKSLLVGGYTVDQASDGQSKIPLLGDIPWVGGLFRTTRKNRSNAVRVFLIEPRVIDSSAGLDPSASGLGADLASSVNLPADARMDKVKRVLSGASHANP